METTYAKLSDLVNDSFTIIEVKGFNWKRWNTETKKMEVSDNWEQGFTKKYAVLTDKGQLDLSAGQLGTLLEACSYKGVADLNGKKFDVKSNGKSGMDIRYFFNYKYVKPDSETKMTQSDVFGPAKDDDAEFDKPIDMSAIDEIFG